MNKIKFIILNLLGYIKNLFYKRDKSIVLFGAWFGKKFADNSRYLFQYLSENKKTLNLTHVVFVTRNEELLKELREMGYEAFSMDSEESIYFHKKAYYHIICNTVVAGNGLDSDMLSLYSCGAKRINLWHGLGGIKGVNFASKEHLNFKKAHPFLCGVKEFLHSLKIYRVFAMLPGGWGECFYLSTTPFETEIMKKYFHLKDKYFINSGYPRNDISYPLLESEKQIIEKLKTKSKVFLYMPTFRNNIENFISPLTKEVISYLEENNILWVEKKHSADKTNILSDVKSDAVLSLPDSFDATLLLPHIDLLLTDYSSVSWDALYHSKPVIFYTPDYDYYINSDRGFVLSPEEFLIGKKAENPQELLEILKESNNNIQGLIPSDYPKIFEKIWGKKMSCSEIWTDILKSVK